MSSQPSSRAGLRRPRPPRSPKEGLAVRGSRHRTSLTRQRIPGRALVAIALVLVLGTIGWLFHQAQGGPACGADAVRLRVVTSSDTGPQVREVAQNYQRTGPVVDGACVRVDVRAMDPAQVGAQLAEAAQRGADPGMDAWMPDSTLWAKAISRRPEVDRLLPDVFSIVASSPVVAAVPEPQAKALGWPGRAVSLEQLVTAAQDRRGWGALGHPEWGPVKVAWPSPTTSSVGLDSLMTLFLRFDRDAATAGDPTIVRAGILKVQNALIDLEADPEALLKPLSDPALSDVQALGKSVILPSTARQVQAFNRRGPRLRLAAVPVGISGQQAKVGYLPLYGTTIDHRRASLAAERFGGYLMTGNGGAPFAEAGWDIPATPVDLVARKVVAPAVAAATNPRLEGSSPSLVSIGQALQSWSALQRRGSVLLVVDVSGSMAQRIPKSPRTRLDLAQQALTAAVTSFSDRSSLGLWAFSRRLDGARDYRVVVPLGRSGDRTGATSRRQAVLAGIQGLRAGGDTGLYDTTLAAVREVRRRWTPGSDVVIVLSDGRNDDPGSISLRRLVSTLRAERDRARPVQIYTIAYGADADAAALRSLAVATGGSSFAARSPIDLQRVLLLSLTS